MSFADVAAKLESGERLSDADVKALEADRDIVALGMLAEAARRKLHGSEVTYLRVADLGTPDLKVGTTPGSVTSVVAPTLGAAGEVRIADAPSTLEEAVTIVTNARDLAARAPLSGFSLFELGAYSEPLPVVLRALKDAGLDLVACAPFDRLQEPERSLEAVTDAGLRVARLTIDEVPDREWGEVCRQIAGIQNRLQSVQVFAPLPRRVNVTQPTTGYEDVKRVALSRLLTGSVQTIQVDWALYGPKLAQVALVFGADDIDAVPAADDDSLGHRRSPIEEIHRSIRAAGFEPVERNALFERRG